MADGGSTIGDRLRRIRGDRGMTQEELAAASGVSYSLISMLERGKRASARLSTISKLANALDCEIGELVNKRDHLKKDRDGGSVLAIRDVLLDPSLLPGIDQADDGVPIPLPEIEQKVTEAWDRYWSGKFGELLAMIPGLIAEARITHASLGAAAVEPLALAYDLASSLMTQIGRTDLGAIAAERAITIAHTGDDELLWALLHASYSWVLLHQGRYKEAESLVVKTAARYEPSFRGSEREVGVWGCLLTSAVAPAVAQDRDPEEYLRLARAGAERLGRRVPVYQTSFATATVAMQATYGYTVLKRSGQALKAAHEIKPGELQGISWGAHLMDVAQAHVDAGHRKTAIRALLEAREVSPVWFRHQRVAKEAVAEIREQETRLSPEVKSLARSLDI
jgi:transcriptional regulator with XRE-family HTH domain